MPVRPEKSRSTNSGELSHCVVAADHLGLKRRDNHRTNQRYASKGICGDVGDLNGESNRKTTQDKSYPGSETGFSHALGVEHQDLEFTLCSFLTGCRTVVHRGELGELRFASESCTDRFEPPGLHYDQKDGGAV